ncbi:uroporphyrinogen-III synthase [Thermoplasma volcanium GSS1]|uniref:Uroporphyrinogen-III synthase n=1 Tax=Thermoplasma volcanium (strain ATCC 51530 / DSM 4299 / JCM 9571 / NBRC 15438 / GSS1) TaxID=273116 RepID=Q97B27_THEVO|nr:uroporphyrinogen-III synthase [Thermoplasma volcanium]BAB59774.1 uroporphyrinogen-III synthase [Thermoplasma volcanium GSS1]
MTLRKFIISLRPAEKFVKFDSPCFDLINIPVTRLMPLDINIEKILKESAADCIVFTSTFGVDLFFSRVNMKGFTILGIGKATCERVQAYGHKCLYPENMDSEGLANLIISKCKDKKILILRSKKANEVLTEKLKEEGIDFLEFRIYDAVPDTKDFEKHYKDQNCLGVIITSSMEAEIVIPFLKEDKKMVFSIGVTTTNTLMSHGIMPDITGNSDFLELLKKIDYFICNAENK